MREEVERRKVWRPAGPGPGLASAAAWSPKNSRRGGESQGQGTMERNAVREGESEGKTRGRV